MSFSYFPFAFFDGFSPTSFDRICRIVSIMARIASGRVKDASCLSIQASSAFNCEGWRRTPMSVPLTADRFQRGVVLSLVDLIMALWSSKSCCHSRTG